MSQALVVDTDIGGDPDDAVALVLAAASPDLALVTTCDELGGRRARYVRRLLDLLGREDVPVVAGSDLGNTRMDCIAGLVPDEVPAQPSDVVAAVAKLCAASPVRWAGLGPASNLAAVLTARPDLTDQLLVTQMGGALNYRDPSRAEHNFRVDVEAARTLVTGARVPTLVMSDTTFTPEIEINRDSPLHRKLSDPGAPPWAHLIAAHMDQWYVLFHHGTRQHDPLTLSAAMGLPFVTFRPERVVLDDIGRMTTAPDGHEVRLSSGADYPAFWAWLTAGLDGP